MSLVGTRPPTLDEWEKYEPHHRAKGIVFFDEIKEQFDYYESTFEKAAKQNTQLVHPVRLTKARKNVLEMYRKWGYGTVEFYFWCRIPKQKAKSIVRRVLPKETRQKIKQLLHK